jgi:hypothetical protein
MRPFDTTAQDPGGSGCAAARCHHLEAFVSTSTRSSVRLGIALGATAALALGVPLTAAVSAPGSHSVGSVGSAAKPGRTGNPISLGSQISLDGLDHPYAIAADKTGTTYVAWISAKANSSTPRQVHLCTLPLHATACKGAVQTANPSDWSTATNLYLAVSASRLVTLTWYHTNSGGGEIQQSTSQAGGPLSTPKDVATAPANGELLDAVPGPNGQIWTVAFAGYPHTTVEVHSGSTSVGSVHVPPTLSYADIAFAGSTPIIAFDTNSATGPVTYSVRHGSTWSARKSVKGAIGVGYPIGLTATKAGVRLVAGSPNNLYQPVVSRWTGHGFTKATYTGDHAACAVDGHETTTDATGRLVDVGAACGATITVSNFGTGSHAALSRFSSGRTTAGGNPQIASLPRGYAWVVWSTQYNDQNSAQGDKLQVQAFLLPGVHRTVSHRGSHGTVSTTGPATCLPPDLISVAVKGHPGKGWKVAKHTLKLSGKTVHSSINGASLAAGKSYSLVGSVTFASGGHHQTVKAVVKFRSCPNP